MLQPMAPLQVPHLCNKSIRSKNFPISFFGIEIANSNSPWASKLATRRRSNVCMPGLNLSPFILLKRPPSRAPHSMA
ncbi:unnamed protein product [Victoria cruziana]